MKKLNLSKNNLINCAIYAVIGLLLIIFKSSSLGILMTLIGVLLIATGILDVVNNQDKTKGIVEIVIGLVIIICGWMIANIVLLIFGILLIIKGAIECYQKYKLGINAILPVIVNIVIGVILVIARWTLIDVFCVIAGVNFIIDAVLMLLNKE